jgi:ABC-type nitrate/sulfonate/bicarbonate transport system substrate-binding protein
MGFRRSPNARLRLWGQPMPRRLPHINPRNWLREERMTSTKRLTLAIACGAALLGALALSTPTVQAKDLEDLHLNYPQANAFYWDFDVAREKGFFKDENFNVVYGSIQSTPQAIQMLISGDVDLTTPQPDALLIAMTRGGKDLGVIAQPALVPDWIFVGSKQIKSFKDLKGKNLGVSALHGSEQSLADAVLAKHGLKPDDYRVIVSGITPQKYAALQNGSISVAVLYQPTAQLAVDNGFPALYHFSDLKPPYPPSYFAVNRKWAANKDHGKRVVRVLMRAHKWLYDPKNRDEAIAILRKYTKRDPALLGKIYDQYFVTKKLYSPDAKVRMSGTQTIIDAMVKRGQLKKGALTPQQVVLPIAVAK